MAAQIKARVVDFSLTFDGHQKVTFELEGDFRGQYAKLHQDFVEISVRKWTQKRSLDANAYLWALITKIANALRESKEDIYLDALKAYGQGGAVSVEKRYCEDFKRSYKYHEKLGETELNGKVFEHYRFLVGSSEYNTEEMSILIDGVVREAKNLGIETMDEAELNSLIGGK